MTESNSVNFCNRSLANKNKKLKTNFHFKSGGKKENLKIDFPLACFWALSLERNVKVLHFIYSSLFKMIEKLLVLK